MNPSTCAVLAALLVLAPAATVQQAKTTRLRAEVVDEQGRPIAGAGIVIGEEADLRTIDALEKPLARSDARGRIEYFMPKVVARTSNTQKVRFVLLACRGYTTVRLSLVTYGYYTPFGYNQSTSDGRDFGRVTLSKAGMLSGRVRGAGGRPLAGARVVGREFLSSGFYARFQNYYSIPPRPIVVSMATTDAKGRFKLTGVFPEGMSLAVFADGYYDQHLSFVDNRHVIDVAMERSGFMEGRVHDADDKPVDAILYVRNETFGYRNDDIVRQLRTKKDGTFRIGIKSRGRYGITATAVMRPGEPYRSAMSKTYLRPRSDIEIELAQPSAKNPPITVEVAVAVAGGDGATGGAKEKEGAKEKPIAHAKAIVLWQDPRYISALTLETAFATGAIESREDGKIELPGPVGAQPSTGAILVKAKGYAPFVQKKLEYDPEKPPTLKVALEKESVVTGVVVDKKTGKPLAGARVFVDPAGVRSNASTGMMYGYNPGIYNKPGVATDDKGRFRVGGLAAGKLEIFARIDGRPKSKTMRVSVGKGAEKTVRVLVPSGVALSGKVFLGRDEKGAKKFVTLPVGWQVRLGSGTNRNMYYGGEIFFSGRMFKPYGFSPRSSEIGSRTVLLSKDGSFRFEGLGAGRSRLELVVPPLGKRGRPFIATIEPFRIRRKDIERDFDISEDMPGVVRGKVKVKGVAFPMSRLLVLSYPGSRPTRVRYNPSYFRCVVEEDGTFAFHSTKGKHHIFFMDAATSTVLYQVSELVEVKNDGPGDRAGTNCAFEIPLARVRVRLVPEREGGEVVVGKLEWITYHKGDAANFNFGRYDRGYGVYTEGRTDFLLYLPPVRTEFVTRSYLRNVDPKGGHIDGPSGEGEITPEMGKLKTLIIKVEAPAEVSEPADK